MRQRRLNGPASLPVAHAHGMSRVVNRDFVFGSEENPQGQDTSRNRGCVPQPSSCPHGLLFGMDHLKRTSRFQGGDFRLMHIRGTRVEGMLA